MSGKLSVRSANPDSHLTEIFALGHHDGPRRHRTDAFGRPGHYNVSRVKRVGMGRERDQFGHTNRHLACRRFLPFLTIDTKREQQIVWFGDLIGGGNPGAHTRKTIAGYAKAAILRPAPRHVQPAAVPRHTDPYTG